MPTFVIHALGRPTTKLAFGEPPVRAGRGAHNQIILGDDTVSREHAVFGKEGKRWWVGCVSETNPIVVDGKMVARRVYLRDGSEVMVGRSHLVIFCETERTAAAHAGDPASTFVKTQCAKCGWAGMVRTARKAPVCPDCGTALPSASSYVRDLEAGAAKEGATAMMSAAQLGVVLQKLKMAKRSRLERVGKPEGLVELGEDKPALLSRAREASLRLSGFTFGGAVRVAWDGSSFVATSTVFFPGMKVNGVLMKSTPLKHGDVIEIASNRFRFFTE